MQTGNVGDYNVQASSSGTPITPPKEKKTHSHTEKKTSDISKTAFTNDDWKNLTGPFTDLDRDQAWDKLIEIKGLKHSEKELTQIGKEMVEQQTRTGAYAESKSKKDDFVITVANTLGISKSSVETMLTSNAGFGSRGVEIPKRNVELQKSIIQKIKGIPNPDSHKNVIGLGELVKTNAPSLDQWFQEAMNDIFDERTINLERKYKL
jgi:hypothetical protein